MSADKPLTPRGLDGTPLVGVQHLCLGREAFKRTDNNSEQMNVDGRAGGTSTVLWNGTGGGDTGGDWTASGTGSETAASNHSGTNGWDSGSTAKDATTVFNAGSLQDVDGSYSELKFWLQPKAFPVGSELLLAFLDEADGKIGNELDVSDYTPNMDLDVWQQVAIPITDFSLGEDVQKLRVTYKKVAGQQHWLDDIELVPSGGSGGPYIFQIAAPNANTIYHVTMIVLMAAEASSGWSSDAFLNLSGGLDLGLVCRQRRVSTSETLWSFNTKDNVALFGQYHPQESFLFNNDELLVGFMVKPGKGSVQVTDDEVLEFLVRDDLSSLNNLRAYCHYGVEEA